MGVMTMRDQERRRCTHLLFTCSDYRLHGSENLARYIPSILDTAGGYDVIAVPGANFGLLHGDEAEQQLIMGWLSLLVDLHASETILLVPHLNCARYHAAGTMSREEDATLVTDLRRTKALLRERFPRLVIVTAIARVDETRMVGIDRISDATLHQGTEQRLTHERV